MVHVIVQNTVYSHNKEKKQTFTNNVQSHLHSDSKIWHSYVLTEK